jgi:hypothetical protein
LIIGQLIIGQLMIGQLIIGQLIIGRPHGHREAILHRDVNPATSSAQRQRSLT